MARPSRDVTNPLVGLRMDRATDEGLNERARARIDYILRREEEDAHGLSLMALGMRAAVWDSLFDILFRSLTASQKIRKLSDLARVAKQSGLDLSGVAATRVVSRRGRGSDAPFLVPERDPRFRPAQPTNEPVEDGGDDGLIEAVGGGDDGGDEETG